jgi:hypothetical protein
MVIKEIAKMDFMISDETTKVHFERARRKAMWNSVMGAVRLRHATLVTLDEAKYGLAFAGQARSGIRQIPLRLIVGTVNRSHDFDIDFNPLSEEIRPRWERVNKAFLDGILLPAVQLRKVGDAYFVVDGHHRVSVAKYHGATYIDAEVYEYACVSEAA